MHPEELPAKKFPICQRVCCFKNYLSDRKFWKKEIESQYQFYLATLRAQRDVKYVNKEHSDILRRLDGAEAENLELRKEIRVLETEMYIMCQRNAHDSAVIDGLHEVDYETGEIRHLESHIRKRLDISSAEGKQEEHIAEMLKEEIDLLQRKDGEDAVLIVSLEPLEQQLKETLQEEKLKNHQQACKLKRDLEGLLAEFHDRITELQVVSGEKSSAILWAMEMYSSLFREREVDHRDGSDAGKSSPEFSSQETNRFDVSGSPDTVTDVSGENFEQMKESYDEFVARKELLDTKNTVTMQMIHECLQQYAEGLSLLAEEYVSVNDIVTEVEFINEYLQRLDSLRRKKEMAAPETSIQSTYRVDQLNLIYHALLSEKLYLEKTLQHFTSTLKEDFKAHRVILFKTEELFVQTEVEGVV